MKKQEIRYAFVDPNTDKETERVLQNLIIEKIRSLRIDPPQPRDSKLTDLYDER